MSNNVSVDRKCEWMKNMSMFKSFGSVLCMSVSVLALSVHC